ncbi:uncharacterized protein LOC134820892 isoform X2 [Bolinopsis microptera]|uniref:uncharacterized protein LOC134820892 isoform X2 n=1 Tax=Bolinopsis microptera TaxID=2820187 RepID=UPI0030797D6C
MQPDYNFSRPETAGTTSSSMYPSSDKSFAYSIISSKFQSTGEVLLLPKVNARRSIRFDKEMTGPKIMAVRETAQWLISNNNRMTDDLSKECRRLDDSYLKWYRKHFNEKKDVLEKVSNLLSHAKKEKTERCRSYQSCYKKSSTPASRMKSTRSTTHHRAGGIFPTELPDVEVVDNDKVEQKTVVQIDSTGDKPEGTPKKEGEGTPTKKGEGTPTKEGEGTVTENKQKNGLTTKRGLSREERNGGVQKTPDSGKKGVRIVEPESKPTKN